MRHTILQYIFAISFILSLTSIYAEDYSVVTIEVYPQKQTMYPGQEYRFIAKGYNRNNKEVPFNPEWTISGGGTIKQDGWFKAGNMPGSYRIRAVDPNTGAEGDAIIVIRAGSGDTSSSPSSQVISRIEILPQEIYLRPRERTKFNVYGYNSQNEQLKLDLQIIWKVDGGSVSEDGDYVAGGAPGKYSIEARTPNGMSASAKVTIMSTTTGPASIKIFPTDVILKPLEQKRFFANVFDNSGAILQQEPYRWEVTGGTIDENGIYTAGKESGAYLIKAITTQGISTTTIVKIEKVKIARAELIPEKVLLYPGQIQKFEVRAYNAEGNQIPATPLWSANGGEIQIDGLYRAGNTPGEYLISVTVGSISIERKITIRPGIRPSRVVIKPEDANVKPGQTVDFHAECYDGAGQLVNVEIRWENQGGGTIDSKTGVFLAGTTPGKFVVKAYLGEEAVSETYVTVGSQIVHRPVARISIEPTAVKLKPGESVQFKARGFHSSGKEIPSAFSWSCGGGNISADGTYVAGKEAGNFSVTVSTTAGVTASAEIAIETPSETPAAPKQAVKLIVNPPNAIVKTGEQCTFHVALIDAEGKAVPGRIQWQATGGDISPDGTYRARDKAGKYSVIVTDLNTGVSNQIDVEVVESQNTEEKLEPLRILRWKTGHGTELVGKIYIEGRALADNSSSVRLVLVSSNGTERILYQMSINTGEKFTFHGEYVRSTTKAIAVVLLNMEGKILFRFERPS